MVLITEKKKEEYITLFQEFMDSYPSTVEGRQHLSSYKEVRRQGQTNFNMILEADNNGEDITQAVLLKLLPYVESESNRRKGAWIHIAPAITGDITRWFQQKGWTKEEEWPLVSKAILRFVQRCISDTSHLLKACDEFSGWSYSKGFQTGMLTPILNALRPQDFLIINNKSRQVINYFLDKSYGHALTGYSELNTAGQQLISELGNEMRQLGAPDNTMVDFFDMFTNWLVTIKKYDFRWKNPIATHINLRDGLIAILADYIQAKSDKATKYKILNILKGLKQRLVEVLAVGNHPEISVEYGTGIGRMANVPWIAFLHNRVTSTTQSGIYCVYLFRADMSGAYLTLNQGVGLGVASGPKRADLDKLHSNALLIRNNLAQLSNQGFLLDDDIELKDSGNTGKAYEKSTIAYKYYNVKLMPTEEELERDLENILLAYECTVVDKSKSYWIFQANPELYDLTAALIELSEMTWLVRQYPKEIHQGDFVFLWLSGPESGIRATAMVLTEPANLLEEEQEKRFYRKGEKFAGIQPRVRIQIINVLNQPIYKEEILMDSELSTLSILKSAQGTQFLLTQKQADTLLALTERKGINMQPAYSISDFVSDTDFTAEEIGGWRSRLYRKMHVIFQGPPGTGKTYVAERLARMIVSGTSGFWETVQFHPSYAYEDFIQGIRPRQTEDGSALTYELESGRFLDFCRRAEKCLNNEPCVLVIDEINRANMSKVFGELMYLLEYRDKQIPLAGGGKPFHIPSNVYIVGTMNTADRSIALVDYAFRRRFSFIRLKPDHNVLRRHLERRGYSSEAEALIKVLKNINTAIEDPNYELGISFFMRQDDRIGDFLQDIWICEIEPYLEEYFYDHIEKIDHFRWNMLVMNELKDWPNKQ